MESLETIVHRALDNAHENGYIDIDTHGNLGNWSKEELANDLIDCDAECAEHERDALIPHIESWIAKRR